MASILAARPAVLAWVRMIPRFIALAFGVAALALAGCTNIGSSNVFGGAPPKTFELPILVQPASASAATPKARAMKRGIMRTQASTAGRAARIDAMDGRLNSPAHVGGAAGDSCAGSSGNSWGDSWGGGATLDAGANDNFRPLWRARRILSLIHI